MKVIVLNNQAIATHENFQTLPANAYPVTAKTYIIPDGTGNVLGQPEDIDPETGEIITPEIPPMTEAQVQALQVNNAVTIESITSRLAQVIDDVRDYRVEIEARLDAIEERLNGF